MLSARRQRLACTAGSTTSRARRQADGPPGPSGGHAKRGFAGHPRQLSPKLGTSLSHAGAGPQLPLLPDSGGASILLEDQLVPPLGASASLPEARGTDSPHTTEKANRVTFLILEA